MSNYWKKKLDELNQEEEKKKESKTDYWGSKMNELEAESKTSRDGGGSLDDDIAPVKEDKKWYEGWFDGGAFKDGYQFGDLYKTVAGSGADLNENIAAGVLGMGEKAVDFGATLVGAVGGIFSDDFAEDTKEFVKKDLYDEKKVARAILKTTNVNYLMVDPDKDSVFGDKSDSIAQSAGELIGTLGLQSAGFPWFVTTGVTSFGSEAENAFNQGASYLEAGISGAISAGAEILTEMISGGIKFGGKTIDDALTKQLTTKISNKAVRTMAKLGMDVVGEGGEEVISQIFSNLGSTLYKKEELSDIFADDETMTDYIWSFISEYLFSEEARNEYAESFIGGAALGGASSGINTVNSIKSGRDATSGLTANEEKVFKQIYEERIAEEGGEELSTKEKNQIYDDVMDELKKGYISTDKIESILGGETYQSYQDTITSEESAIKELESLYEGAELESAIKNITDNSKRTELQNQLSKEVSELTSKDDYLAESYFESERRKQAFTADLSKYDEKSQTTIKKAIESGVLNDTRRTHEFVDMVAKISADKGVLFDFTDNKKLQESGFALKGKPINGFVTKDGITVNIESQKSFNSIVGHEITHVLEGTEFYNALQETIFEYAKTKGVYESMLKETNDLYKDIEGYKGVDGFNKIKREVVSDLVGEYLFTDPDFISNLSTKNRNVFQKVYDEIKYLCKVATAGSKEARELERVKHAFEKAYRADGKADGDTKYSLSDSDGKNLTKEQQEYFKDSKMRDDNGNLKVMYHGSQDAGFHTFDSRFSDDDTSFFFVDRNDVAASYSGTTETYEAKTIRTAEDMNKFIESIDAEGYEVIEKDGKFTLLYEGDRVAESDTAQGIYKEFCWYEGVGEGDANYKVYLNLTNPLEIDAKGRNWNNVSREFSQEIADRYHSLTAEEKAALTDLAEWGEYGVFRDELLSVAKAKADGNIDDVSADLASAYEKLGGANANLYDAFSIASDNFSDESIKEFAVKQMNTRDYAKMAKDGGYDGVIFKNIVDNGGYSNGSEGASTVAIAFDSNQIKSVANEKPTENADIRYSLSKETDKAYLDAVNRGETEAAQKMVDDAAKNAGYTIKAYHGTPNAEFTVFDKGRLGKGNDQYGAGFYFATDKEAATHYGKRVIDTALNIKNPIRITATADSGANLIDADVTLTQKQAYEVIKRLPNIYDAEESPLGDYYDSYWEEGAQDWMIRDLARKNRDVGYLDSDLFRYYPNELHEALYDVVGYDGVEVTFESTGEKFYVAWFDNQMKSTDAVTYDDNGKVIPLSERFKANNNDIRYTLSENGKAPKSHGRYNVYGKDVRLEKAEEIAPVGETVKTVGESVGETVPQTEAADIFPDDIAPMTEEEAIAFQSERLESITDADAPAETSDTEQSGRLDTTSVDRKALKGISDSLADVLALENKEKKIVQEIVQRYSNAEIESEADLFDEIESRFRTRENVTVDEYAAEVKRDLKRHKVFVSPTIKGDIPDFAQFMRSNFGRIRFSKEGSGVDQVYMELSEKHPNFFPASIENPTDQLLLMSEVAKFDPRDVETYELGDDEIQQAVDIIVSEVGKYKDAITLQGAEEYRNAILNDIAPITNTAKESPRAVLDEYAKGGRIKTVKERLDAKLNNFKTELSNNQKLRKQAKIDFDNEIAELQAEYDAKKNKNTKVANNILRRIERLQRFKANVDADYAKRISNLAERVAKTNEEVRTGQSTTEQGAMRRELHQSIIDDFKSIFAESGFDFDAVLKKAKNLSTFATVDNTPQRVMEKSLGYKEGHILSDLTVNQVARNETEAIKWLNSFTDRKNGLLAQISKQYKIKSGSKESAAAQMYAEGFYVSKDNQIIKYGEAELKKDFPNEQTRANIIGLATDERIRRIYDETLDKINESRARNAYPEIPKLANYFLHFRAMEDTFSRLGLPFNPNDIRAKDLPTDLNGVTADLKPGQPYFASAMHRRGQRTSFDLLGGLERYLSSAKNQIYHIDDIQTLRALRNYVADTYGQANGLESLNDLTEEEAQERIKQVFGSHLSTFAKFLNEEANILAGKTALIDRGLEGIIGRRGITFLDTLNKQVGSNMVGFNISSSLTNFLSVAQAVAKTNKASFVKAFAQTASNKIGSIFGKNDGFAENSPVMIRRKGSDRFHRTPFQKIGDAGYVLMSAVDDISTEIIARAKYNEFTKNGMDSETAHIETDKWVSRLMGDRSLGQMPQLYNSKMLGLITKFQLEVRNQLDSQFYDTIQDAKVSNEEIENKLVRNAKTAAKVTSTFVQLAVAQHLFGKAFESVAGYNPAFDIIETLIKVFGFDDDEESEDTVLDNIEQGFLNLIEDLPYTSTLTGGRVPISSALPITELIKGEDKYGVEKSRLETLSEIAPYYVLPTGYGQIKKTVQGLSMFSGDHPVAGSYTDSGGLRFPVDDTLGNRVKAGLFGQWANENAREYFDNDIAPLNEKQTQEFIDSNLPIGEYWKYREGLSEYKTLAEKADYINSLDLSPWQKNLLINNIAGRKDPIDMDNYGEYSSFEEFDYAEKNPEKYAFFKNNGISYYDYASADEDGKRAYTWAYENPEAYEVSKAVTSDLISYKQYTKDLYDIRADKDENGDSIVGSAKEKKIEYINNLDLDYGQKIILFKSLFNADDTYNYDIIEYLNSRDDISYKEMENILKELGFTVDSKGNISWD